MRIHHIFPSTTSHADVNTIPAFFQRNQAGDWLSLYSERQSRYEGWFVQRDEGFFKLLERIELVDSEGNAVPVTGITNTGSSHYWKYADGSELGWKLLATLSGLTIRANRECRLRVSIDPRGMYEHPEFGRRLELVRDKSGLLVRYSDMHSPRPAYLHLRSRGPITPESFWQDCQYPRDATRNSEPSHLYTYVLATTFTDSLAFGYGNTAQEASLNSLSASRQRPVAPPEGPVYGHQTLVNQVVTARLSVQQSLRWLQTSKGQWAGLPWFHQVWARDELIAGLGLSRDLQHQLLDLYLGQSLEQGELFTYVGSGTSCADGVGWLCLLASQYAEPDFPIPLERRLLQFLRRAQSGLTHRKGASGLILSGNNATWMDTIGRDGIRLEIQCMYGKLLELLYDLTKETQYVQERLQLLTAIRQQFFKGGYLWDGVGDGSIRPNVFIAYLLQPDLLSARLWQSAFDTAMQALWLPWGGLASLDGRDERFQEHSTGQNNRSYHNGDSWFFINNLAAVALHRFDAKRYGEKINGILEASTSEILWHNFLGMPGEISSAAELNSWGCGLQAFSGGTYLWLLRELEGYSAGQELDSSTFFWDSTAKSSF